VIRSAAIAITVLALGGVTALRAADSGTAAPYPTRLQAVADEFTLSLSRTTIRNRWVRIELVNFGEDPHDLRFRRIGGAHTFFIGQTLPGARRAKSFRLPTVATASGARSPTTAPLACALRSGSVAPRGV